MWCHSWAGLEGEWGGEVTVCFKKSNGYHLHVAFMLVPFFPPSLVWSCFFLEVRRSEDNTTPQRYLRCPLIFDRSLNRYFGAKRDNGACRSSPFFSLLKLKYVSCMLSHSQLREIFSTEPLFGTQSCLISPSTVKGKRSHWALWNEETITFGQFLSCGFGGETKISHSEQASTGSRCSMNSCWTAS